MRNRSIASACALLVLTIAAVIPRMAQGAESKLHDDLTFFAGIEDRSAGSKGSEAAADHIVHAFEEAGLTRVGSQKFQTPIPEVLSASLELNGEVMSIHPWGPNLVYLSMTPDEGLAGPLVYAGSGELLNMNGLPMEGSIVLMEMDSGCNWMNAAMLGARALVYLGRDDALNGAYKEKNIPTPVAFPRFWAPPQMGARLKAMAALSGAQATVRSKTRWQNKVLRNCYGLLPGSIPSFATSSSLWMPSTMHLHRSLARRPERTKHPPFRCSSR